jgi:TolB protein
MHRSGCLRVSIRSATAAIAVLCMGQTPAPNEGALGTVEVTGAAGIVLPKLAVIPVTGEDAEIRDILKKDLDRIGLYDIAEEANMPAGPFGKDDPLEGKAWKAKGISYVVRARFNGSELEAQSWILAKGDDPVGTVKVKTVGRRGGHELADQILLSLTGRTGPFASRLAYAQRTKNGRQMVISDVDGAGKVPQGPSDDTSLSPAFGPNGELYYTISKNYAPFHLVKGTSATLIPIKEPGSVLSVAFSPDKSKMAVGIQNDKESKLFFAKPDGTELTPVPTEKFTLEKNPNRPVFGPMGKFAYVANINGIQRVIVDGKPVSPAGFHASAPTFCDSPQGLLVVFTVGVGSGADLIATDTSGGSVRRLTQGHGSNAYPACSPDGRLVAFFSTGSNGKSPALYALPLSYASRIRKLSDDYGDALAWSR